MPPQRADELLFWQYSEAKRRWRRHTGKPVRAVRRVLRRKGKGGGKAKGKGHHYVDIAAFFQQDVYYRNKGKGGKSSGKGFGRRQNPRGRDGEIMRCSICNSDTHLRAHCSQAGSGEAPRQGSAARAVAAAGAE